MESKVIIPYSQHHRDYAMMIGKPCTQAVFEYLFDEYQARMRAGKPTAEIPFSKSKIARARFINRETVGRTIEALEKTTLITINENYYSLNGKLYMALIKAFSVLPYSSRPRFTELLTDGRIDELEAFGVSLDGISERDIAEMYGSIVETDGNSAGMSKNQQWCRIFDKFTTDFADFSSMIREKLTDFRQVCRFLDTLTNNEMPESDIAKLANAIINGKSTLEDDEMQIFLLMGCRFFVRGVSDFRQGGVDFPTPEINNNKIKKESTTQSVALKKEQDSFFEQDLEQVNLDSNIPEQDKQENDEPSIDIQIDDNIMRTVTSRHQLSKKQKRIPFFQAYEVERYASHLEECVDRADKIFINQLWGIFHDHFDIEEELDEDGNVLAMTSNDVENIPIPRNIFQTEFIERAIKETESIIQSGFIEVNGQRLDITAQPIELEEYMLIVDFDIKTVNAGNCYIISTSRIHNIFADEVTEAPGNVKTNRGGNEEGKEDDYTFMQKLIQMASNGNLVNQLTVMEYAVMLFLDQWFDLDENGAISDRKQSFVSEKAFRDFIATEIHSSDDLQDIQKEDFVSVFFNNRLREGGIDLRNRMFSAQKIRNWNAMHGLQSVVDEYELTSQEGA